jgi:hypothetical protein
MRRIFIGTLALYLGNFLYTQQVNDPDAVTLSLSSSFSTISVAAGFDLMLRQSNVVSIAVRASKHECRNKIFIGVVDGVLEIYSHKEKGIKRGKNRHLAEYVTCISIDALTDSSCADGNISGLLSGNSLRLTASYGSDIVGVLNFTRLDAAASSGSEITLSGKDTIANINCRGGGDFNGIQIYSESCTVASSSGSSTDIMVNKELKANTSSGSRIKYRGGARIKSVSQNSGSTVNEI